MKTVKELPGKRSGYAGGTRSKWFNDTIRDEVREVYPKWGVIRTAKTESAEWSTVRAYMSFLKTRWPEFEFATRTDDGILSLYARWNSDGA